MIQKAIIEQKIDKYSMRVRIPVYNKIKSDPTATPTDELYVASIQTLPGCSPNYQEGDVVLVDFENDNIAYPVIIGLLYRQDMSEGSTDITADSLTVNVNTNLSENTLIGNVTPESIQKLNDKYTNNVKKVVIEYSLSNYEDHYDMFSQWSEQAPQYWPNKYMWQRTTVTYENDTITRSMTCIQGAKGDSGSTITIQDSYVKYAISSSGTTPPSTTAPNTWFVNPPQTTDVNPYLWSWTYIRYSDGHVTNTFGVSRVSENSTIVYLYKRSASTISQIDWNNNLTYDFDSKQLVSTPTGWSESIPIGNDPIYVTAATASSIESTDSITPGEWSTPLLFTKSGFNSKTILLYKRGVSTPAVPSVSVTYTFSNGSIYPSSPDGWSLAVPTTDGNPCFVTQATAISYDDTDTILTTEWSTPSVLARDGNSDYIDEDIVDWYIATSTATPPTTPTTDIEVATEWTSLGWTNNVNSITLSDTNKYLWNAEVTHYTISGYVKNNPHIITIYAEAGKGIDTVTEYYALSNSTSSYPEIGSASWQTTPLTPTSSNRYLWNYEVITYTVGSPTTTTPAIICMYAEDGQDGKGIQSITNYYLATDQDAGITTSSQGWTTTIQSMTAVNKYLWNYEVIAYTRGTPTTTTPCIIGVYGDRGNDGVGVQSATVTYAVSDSGTTPPQTGWSSTFPSTIQDGQYLWTKTVIQYTNNTSSTVYSVSKDGVAGRGISSITNYYAVSSNGSTAPSSWQTTVPTMTATDKYLWNYEVVSYSDGSTPTETAKRVIGVYGDTGAAGKGISSIVEYYLASPLSTGVTTSTTGWTTTIQTVDATKKYLWNYEVVNYTEGTPFTSTPVIIGTFSNSITSSTVNYAVSNSGSVPPETGWQVSIPTVSQGQYLWTRTVTGYTDGTEVTSYSVGREGLDGTNGKNNAVVYLYKRSSSAATVDWTETLTYSFVTNTLSSVPSGWSTEIPSGTAAVYVTAATASSANDSDTIAYTEWATPVILVKNGSNGSKAATVFLYQRSALNPASIIKPTTDLTYTFSTGVLSGTLGNWSQTIPVTDGNPCYYIQATAIGTGSTDTIGTSEWSNVTKILEDGVDGVGISSTVITYGVSSSETTEPSSWQSTVPTLTKGQWLWVKTVYTYTDTTTKTVYTKSYVGTDGADGTSVYVYSATKTGDTTTVVLKDTEGNTTTLTIQDGEDGENGQPGANGYVHTAWANSADGSVDFSTTVSTNKKYLGVYTDNTQADSQVYSDYSWSLIKGADGLNNAIVYLYKRSATAATIDWASTLTYNFVSKSLTSTPSGWSETIPSGTDPIYVTAATASSSENTDTIPYTEWAAPIVLAQNGQDGSNGVNGLNTATVFLYKRAESASGLAVPSGDLTYTFATGILSGNLQGWTQNIPTSDGNPCYIIQSTAVSTDSYDTIHSNEWSSIVELVSDGTDGTNGTDGISITNVTEYFARNNSNTTAPTSGWSTTFTAPDSTHKYLWNYESISYSSGSPTTTTPAVIGMYSADGQNGADGRSITGVVNYYLATNADSGVTTETSGWTTTVQSVSSSKKYLWNYEVVQYDSGSPTTTTPCIIGAYGDTGNPGTNGLNNAVVYLYKRSSTAATINWTSTLTYTFSTHTLNSVPSGWNAAIPSGTDPLYVTAATASSNTATDTIAYTEWATPVILSQNGTNGTDGTNGTNTATIFLYQRALSAASLTKPSSTLTYTFATGTLTGALGNWSQSIPTTNGNPCFVIQATAISTTATDTITSNEWSEITELVADGEDGDDGKGIVSIVEYYAINNSSTTPPASGSSDWKTTPQTPTALKRYLWNYEVITYTYGDPTTTAARVMGMYSEDGAPGTNTATVFLYQRAASSSGLSKPSSALTYTFATGALTGTLGNWSQTIPATNGNPCFAIQATAIGTGTTDTIQSSEWSNIVKLIEDGQDGTNGTDGINTAVVYLYKRSSTAATIDWTTSLTYTFESKSLSSIPSGWSATISSGSDPIYVTAATAASNQATDTILYTEWATPVILAQNGQDGIDGLNNAIVYLYKRSATAATINWTSTLIYNFVNKSLESTPTGWSETIPSGTNPIYVTAATASSNTSTDTISYNEWSAPVMLAQNGQNGTNGTDGVNSATVFLYQRSATTPTAKPTGNSTYTFATGILTGTLGNWTQAIPASNGNPCYVIQATAVSTEATDTIAASEWSNIVRFVADGEDGDPGKGITQVINRYLAWPNDTGVTRSTSGWTTTIQTVTSTNKYLWNYEEIVYTDSTSSYTDPCIIGVYGDTGVGIASVTEYYALSTTTTRPTTGWTTTLPTMDATNRYLWNYSLITYTDGSTSGSQADALIIGAYGESVLSLEIESDNGTLFNSKTTSTTLTAAVYLGVTQLTVNNNGSVSSGGTTVGQLNWFAKERFTGNGTAKTFDLGLTILNHSTTPNVTITINGTVTSAYTITDNDTITFTNAPANNSVIDIQYLTSSSKSLQIDRTDVRNQIIITCKLVSGANVLTISETTIKDLNDATSLKNWYMLTVDGVEFVSLPTVVYNENDSTVIPTGSYDYDDSGTTVTETFTWLDTEPVVNENNLTKLCYFFSMIIFSDGSCSAGDVERNYAFDSAVTNYLAAQEAGGAAGQAQDAADQAQETANGASEQAQENSEAITGIQQTLVSIDGILSAKLDTVTFTPYKENIDNFMQFDTVNGIMTIGSGNFKQQLTATKNSFLEGSTEVAYISNQELYINNTTINQKMTLDSQWVITFDSTNGLIVKHM